MSFSRLYQILPSSTDDTASFSVYRADRVFPGNRTSIVVVLVDLVLRNGEYFQFCPLQNNQHLKKIRKYVHMIWRKYEKNRLNK